MGISLTSCYNPKNGSGTWTLFLSIQISSVPSSGSKHPVADSVCLILTQGTFLCLSDKPTELELTLEALTLLALMMPMGTAIFKSVTKLNEHIVITETHSASHTPPKRLIFHAYKTEHKIKLQIFSHNLLKLWPEAKHC